MDLFILLIIIIGLFLVYLMSCTTTEFLTPNPYQIVWQAPENNGGDPNCCNYDWQICSDAECSDIVDSGSTNKTLALTTKLDWATTYNIWVRASNVSGKGDWTKVQLSTGDGVLSSISIGQKLSSDGTVTIPLSEGDRNISIWTSLSKGSVSPNTLSAVCMITITRGGSNVLGKNLLLKSGMSGEINVFSGNFNDAGFPSFNFKKGDVVNAEVIIRDSNNIVITDAINTTTVTNTVPAGVTGITLTYSATPPPIPFVSDNHQWIESLYSQNPSPYKTIVDFSSAALARFKAMPSPKNDAEYQIKMSLFVLSKLDTGTLGVPGPVLQFAIGLGCLFSDLSLNGWDYPSIAAAFAIYRRIPADPNLAAIFNYGSGIPPPADPKFFICNNMYYLALIEKVLAIPASEVKFSPGLNTNW